MNLTSQDINQLLEALTVWEKEPSGKALQDTMFSTLLSGLGPEEGREQRIENSKIKTDAMIRKGEMDVKLRRESSIILQAKLIQLRNSLLNTELAES